MSESPKLVVNDSVIYTTLDDEALLLNVENGIYFGLDGVGARIWELLEPGATVDEIYRQLLSEYDVDPPQLRRDVEEFVELLESKGLTRQASK